MKINKFQVSTNFIQYNLRFSKVIYISTNNFIIAFNYIIANKNEFSDKIINILDYVKN